MSIHLNYDYLDRVRRAAELYTKRKTSDLLDGDFQSRMHGRSLDFDDLREYHYGDDVNYIDWKSSSRAGRTLVRRYFADRKHNVLFIGDTGKKMTGDTPAGESKEHIALMAFGVSAYLFGKQGVNYALACCGPEGPRISPFLSSPGHLEELIYTYQRAMEEGEPRQTFAETLANTAASFSRHMIMVIITDGEGLAEINRELVRRLIYYNDVYIFKIEDAYMTSFGVYDLDGTPTAQYCDFKPGKATYDLNATFDNYLAFNKLPAGTYLYKIEARDIRDYSVTLIEKKFTLTDDDTAPSNIELYNYGNL